MPQTPVPSSAEIRQQFLDFFASKGHTIVPSASLVPVDDPTLLFTNAGMNQFKDIFLNLREPAARRVADAQKCLRVSGKHNDLEDVGRSPYHHTLFEMLGNWSFGDYYKDEAIAWAWELLTDVWKLPKERLWATVFEDEHELIARDAEAAALWRSRTDIDPSHIIFFGRKDNFWEMGDTGPCGPCSEIHLDRGLAACDRQGEPGHICRVNGDCRRFIELWNLVFVQYDRTADGQLLALPARHVDTGMGFERLVAVLQGVRSNYETDLFTPIIARMQELVSASADGPSPEDALADARRALSYRVIADHGRAITFLIGDGVLPANEGRGYVLRLILRRAARYGRMLGIEKPFLAEIARTVIDIMASHYDDLRRRQDFILTTIEQEEARFSQALTAGLGLLQELVVGLKAQGETVIPGDEAFRLYDTHGFPLDLVQDEARNNDMVVDLAGYQAALEDQKRRARAAAHFESQGAEDVQVHLDLLRALRVDGVLSADGVKNLAEESVEVETTIAGLIRDGRCVAGARAEDRIEVVLPVTAFYVESGGQIADTGLIVSHDQEGDEPVWQIRVDDVRQPVPGLIIHVGEVTRGEPAVGDRCWAEVDSQRRMDIMRNHTATHLLHSELRYVLGEHVHQAGSVVSAERLRFDFSHPSMLTQDELDMIEQSVNDAILADYPVQAAHSSYRAAVDSGAMALFTEKYGEDVRVVKIGWEEEEFSRELCGGTHVSHTGQIGLFHIVSEEGVGAGVRRIEAVTGRAAQEHVQARLRLLDQAAAFLRVPPDEIGRAVRNLVNGLQAAEKERSRLMAQLAVHQADRLADRAVRVADVAVLAIEVADVDVQTLREMCDRIRTTLGSSVVALATVQEGKPQLIVAVTDDLVKRGLHAGELVKRIAREVGGGGGGKATLAQAGGRDAARLPGALALVPELIRDQIERQV